MEQGLAKGKHIAQRAKHVAAASASVAAGTHKQRGHRHICILLTVPVLALAAGLGAATLQNHLGSAERAVAQDVPAISMDVVPTQASDEASAESFILESGATRNVDATIQEVQVKEEEARIAAEEAERAAEEEAIRPAQEAQSKKSSAAVGIGNVDFTVGHDAFVAEWTERIDNYLAGFPLAGHGADFAEAAWQHGVDPRWSPAISMTESTKGTNCFMAYNAWGWTGSLGGNWSTAIYNHVAGLAAGYGHTITRANAAKYCPPNADHWYSTTLSEMAKI